MLTQIRGKREKKKLPLEMRERTWIELRISKF